MSTTGTTSISQEALVQRQFGAHAPAYANSQSHARGDSLARVVDVLQPQPDWRVLDVATGAGHMALALAPHVHEVIASDLTPQMLSVTRDQVRKLGVLNVRVQQANAESLPFRMSYFNAVTCRIAPHHFARVDRFVGECARVLALSGRVAIVDNVAPEEGGEYLDMFERLRDPSHVHCLTVAAWKRQLYDAGFDMMHHENLHKRMDFAAWVAQQRTPPEIAEQLADMLRNAPAAAAWWLRPEIDSAGTVQAFTLTEGLFVARRRD